VEEAGASAETSFIYLLNTALFSGKKHTKMVVDPLIPSLPAYKYFLLKNLTRAAIFTPLCNSITHQSIVLKSYSNPQKT